MRHIVSVSLGSSRRDHSVTVEFCGQRFKVERIGTDGDVRRAVDLIRELDGMVDAFGMGGIDLYIAAGKRRYVLRGALPLARAARRSPIVDGSGLKNTLERRCIDHLVTNGLVEFHGRKVLLVCAVDRFGMAEALAAAGADLIMGDLAYVLGLPIPIRTLRSLDILARLIAPVVSRLPFEMLYPTGGKQEKRHPKHTRFFDWAEVVAGDFHFIRRYMPERLEGKTVLTNTVTRDDVQFLRRAGVARLITTTPELSGRSFGTNVMEAVLVTLAGKRPEDMTERDYHDLLDRAGFAPHVYDLD